MEYKKEKPQIPYRYKGIWGLTKAGEEGLEHAPII